MPILINKICKTVTEPILTDEVADKRIKVLVEEWKNKVQVLQKVRVTDLARVKRVLGIQAQDLPIVDYWSRYLR